MKKSTKKPKVQAVVNLRTKMRYTCLTVIQDGDGKEISRTESTYGVCQKCQCTDWNCPQCIAKTGKPCSWVNKQHTLCSACAVIGPIAWEAHPHALGFNPEFAGYTAAPASTGQPERGWALFVFVFQGACWEQRTKTVLPPEPGAEPRRIDGEWLWVRTS